MCLLSYAREELMRILLLNSIHDRADEGYKQTHAAAHLLVFIIVKNVSVGVTRGS